MRNKGQISTLGLVIGLVVLIVVALALIMVVTGRIGGVGTSVGEQEEGVFDKIGDIIEGFGDKCPADTPVCANGVCCESESTGGMGIDCGTQTC